MAWNFFNMQEMRLLLFSLFLFMDAESGRGVGFIGLSQSFIKMD